MGRAFLPWLTARVSLGCLADHLRGGDRGEDVDCLEVPTVGKVFSRLRESLVVAKVAPFAFGIIFLPQLAWRSTRN